MMMIHGNSLSFRIHYSEQHSSGFRIFSYDTQRIREVFSLLHESLYLNHTVHPLLFVGVPSVSDQVQYNSGVETQ